ncbi:TonB-dependent receptor [Flavobacterium pedocola]
MKPIFIFVFFLFSNLIQSQSIQGNVKDKTSNEPLAGSTVFIVEKNKTVASDANGNFEINNLASGTYVLKVSHAGYLTEIRKVNINKREALSSVIIPLEKNSNQLEELVISSAFFNSTAKNTYQTAVVKKENLQKIGAITIMDAIRKVPGVDAISSGTIVARPIIRGLSGNRVLTITDGMRFETQQWDDEHGIGLNELGIDRVEIIKGPASFLYGPEAMGGIVNFINEQPTAVNTKKTSVSSRLFSNNLGANSEVSYQSSKEKFNWGISALGRLHSDYFYKGYSFRVPNTRVLEYGAKGYAGKNWKWGSSTVNYTFNKAYYGILDGKDIVKKPDGSIVNIDSLEAEKFPFEIEAPFHTVTDYRLSNKSTFLAGKSKFTSIIGYQINNRTENEESKSSKKGYRYLNMNLNTFTYDLKWYVPEWKKISSIFGIQGLEQKNRNLKNAAAKLIPDARISDLGFLNVTKMDLDFVTFSVGLRYDKRWLSSGFIDSNTSVHKSYDNFSTSFGSSFKVGKNFTGRISYGSGYRTPNLNELFSNGVKLESQHYEIGNLNFTKETNNEIDFNFVYNDKDFSIEGAVFNNAINNYIFIAPTGLEVPSNLDPTVDVPEYKFYQTDARIYGFEAGITIHPTAVNWLALESKISALKGRRLDNDSYLPMMPPTKIMNSVTLNLKDFHHFTNSLIILSTTSALEQNKVAENESKTNSYTLLNATIGTTYKKIEFTLAGTNILDKQYLNHMSRFRSYDIIEPGINVTLGVKVPLNL